MSPPVKLLFDENFGRPIIRALAQLLCFHESRPVVYHFFDKFESGVPDAVWIPEVAQEGFIVVTCDRGKRGGGRKLPAVCKACNVTHVLVGPRLHQQKQFEKVRAILIVWSDLLALEASPKGSCYLIKPGPSGHMVLARHESGPR